MYFIYIQYPVFKNTFGRGKETTGNIFFGQHRKNLGEMIDVCIIECQQQGSRRQLISRGYRIHQIISTDWIVVLLYVGNLLPELCYVKPFDPGYRECAKSLT